ncbi:MAG: DUF748 domain-containing protein [Acidobacteriia bacterium]|nr:DUF748 domain-containing protein [Terriglobia bacterium]
MDIRTTARHPALLKALAGTVAAIAAYALLGFLAAPPLLRSVMVRELKGALHRTVSIEKVRVNPFVLSVTIDGLTIADRDGATPFASIEELYANLQLASLFRWAPVTREILVRGPKVVIVRDEDLTYNFSDLLRAPAHASATPPKPLRYSLNNIRIEGGSVDFDDRPKKTRHAVRDLALAIPFVSNLPYALDEYVQPSFAARINGTAVTLAGKTKPFADTRETVFDVDLADLDIPYYLAYLPFETRSRIVSGRLDAKASLSFTQRKDGTPALLISGRTTARDLAIVGEDGAALVKFPRLEIVLASLDVFGSKARIESVRLENPEVAVRLAKGGGLNLSALVPSGESKTVFAVLADEIRVTGGKVALDDETPAEPFRALLDPVDVTIRHFSTAPGRPAAVDVSLRTDAGESLTHSGSVTLDPLAAEGQVGIRGVPLKRYAPYYAASTPLAVEDGVLEASARYRYSAEGFSASGLSLKLDSLRLREKDKKEDLARIPEISLTDGAVDLAKRTISIAELSTAGGTVFLKREAATPVAPAPSAAAAPASPAAAPADWTVTLARLGVNRYTVRFEDLTTPHPVALAAEGISISADSVSTAKGSRGKASLRLRLNRTGTLSASGTVALSPLSASLALVANGLDLVPLHPYFEDRIRIELRGGTVSAKGKLEATMTPEGALRVGYSGEASVAKLATADTGSGEDFLNWDSLYLSGIEAATDPLKIRIAEVALTDFYSRVAIHPDGKLNLQRIVGSETTTPPVESGIDETDEAETAPGQPEEPPPPPSGSTPAAPLPIAIDKVTLQGGTINFSDHFIKPNYFANLTEVGGRISGLSSEASTTADVDLKGRLDHQAPLEITGKINPLRGSLYADVKAAVHDIEMSPFTPYSGKFAGYAIEKGKFSMDVQYHVENGKLDASNKLFLDQFTFGEKVDSPDATSLPVRLAVSLLKDRNGEIHLDLPVKGSLNDPKFSVWRIVLKIIRNVLVKAATSPFALLRALAGGAEELSYVEFADGRSTLDAPAKSKLESLEKALYDHPALKLEITGHVDPEKDREGLRRLLFDRKVKAQKAADLLKKGAAPVPVDDVAISPEEYPAYLTRAYKKERFPKPRNFLGIAKELPVPEMEKLMLTHVEVGDGELRQLAMQRAQAAKDALLAPGRVEAERVFLVEPKTLPPEKKAKLGNGRVDFVIR